MALLNQGHRDELALDIAGLADWLSYSAPPAVVARPLGIESREQLQVAAKELVATCNASLLLVKSQDVCGDPPSPAGGDHPALHWLCDAKDATGLPVAVEVASTAQVEVCLAAGVDVLLVGTQVIPESRIVKEVAAALRGVRIPVLVENAPEPDVGLWARALELLNGADLREIAAVHRGFFFSHDAVPCYQPKWEIPIELMRMAPDLPMLCDLSATIGNTEIISDVAQAAMDLDMDGLVAEVDLHPLRSVREANGVFTVRQLEALLVTLEVRKTSPSSTTVQGRIDALRKTVDSLDRYLLDTISKRQEVVDRIAKLKKDEDVTVLQLQRWREIVHSRTDYGRELGLDEELVQSIFEVIHSHAIARQREMLKERSAKPSRAE